MTLGNEVLSDGAKITLGNGTRPQSKPGTQSKPKPESRRNGDRRFLCPQPVSVTVGILLAVLFGTIALLRLPIQMIPTVDRPEITVETDYRGAAPLEVEREVTDRLEEKLNAVEHLKQVSSTSIEGKSTVVLKFDWGTNKDCRGETATSFSAS